MRRDTGHLNRVDVLQIGDMCSDHGNIGWLIGATTVRDWCQVRAVGLDQDAIKWTQRGGFGDVFGGLESDDPRETQKSTDI